MRGIPYVQVPTSLLASLSLGAADQPAGRGFLMLGGITQLVDAAGKVVWERKSPESKLDNRSFCSLRNAAGHTLISLTVANHVIEVDADGKVVWELRDGDLPELRVNRTTALAWLPNGNIVFSNYAARAPQPKLVEITRAKQIVWTYTDASKEGVHEFELLDDAGKPLAGVLR